MEDVNVREDLQFASLATDDRPILLDEPGVGDDVTGNGDLP